MLKQVKIRKHEQTAIVLFAIAMVLLIISLQVDGNAVGILQGMATGSISGLVLLIVSGIKNWELRELSEQYDAIHEFNCIILKTNVACNQFLHQLNYSNTDNLSFGEYQMMFREAYDKVADDFSPMSKVKFQVIHSENNKNEMMEYKQYIDLKMAEAFITLTMTTAMERKQLEQVAERFNEISGKGFWFYLKNMELENTLLAKRERMIAIRDYAKKLGTVKYAIIRLLSSGGDDDYIMKRLKLEEEQYFKLKEELKEDFFRYISI